eukprot:CAMPEP_0119272340 /NCGR_PEP_ID=MMETSP1329-20130426/8562_1 /TAXON_ID=114041 /ORGANISM="Genus nov. species nov., Strain RCC1024" /LENGTH=178 /DNA_ID=CAMNT_0007272403 /DNA_START=438 /DNA_END=972 /DNA_ORIENTATION=-
MRGLLHGEKEAFRARASAAASRLRRRVQRARVRRVRRALRGLDFGPVTMRCLLLALAAQGVFVPAPVVTSSRARRMLLFPAIKPSGFTSRLARLTAAMSAASKLRARLYFAPPCVAVGNHGAELSSCDKGWDAYVDLAALEDVVANHTGWRPSKNVPLVARGSLAATLAAWPRRVCVA